VTNVVLINPPSRSGYGDLADDLSAIEPPAWSRMIAGYLRDRGFRVFIIDADGERLSADDIGNAIARMASPPRIACVVVHGHQPSASTQLMGAAEEVCRAIKIRMADVSTMVVGGHPSALPVRTLLECSDFDYACVGEGPITIERLLQGDKLAFVPGLVWRNYASGEVVVNSRAPLLPIDDLRGNAWYMLPPLSQYRAHNWQCLDGWPRSPYASIYTTLGCPYSCLTGDTVVNTIYGDIPIKELSEKYGDQGVPVYTYDPKTGKAFVADSVYIRMYGRNKRVVRVSFDDGSHIDCTPDHMFLQFKWGNGRSPRKQWQCEAQDLVAGAHVRAVRFEQHPLGRVYVSWGRKSRQLRSRMVMEYILGRKLRRVEHVHHVDRNKSNDLPGNLKHFASAKEHFVEHPEIAQRMRVQNPARHMTPVWRGKLAAANRGLRRSPEAIDNYRTAARRRSTDPAYREKLRQAALSRGPRGSWWTAADGTHYVATVARARGDRRGRIGFNPHRMVNHCVVSVTELDQRQDVYCLTVPATGWFFANNVLVKNCHFCMINAPFDSHAYRMRQPQHVAAEIVRLYRQFGVRTFKIVDEMFILNPRHYGEICNGIIEAGIGDDINIWAYARVDTVRSDRLAQLRNAGFRWLALGIESASAYVRDGARKRLKNDDIIGVVRAIQAAGINVIGNFIFGLPDDDFSSMRATLALAQELNCEFANFYSAMAYPGSPLYAEAAREGWDLPSTWDGYSQHGYETRPLATRALAARDALAFRDQAFDAYFGSARYTDMIGRKFGDTALMQLKKMREHAIPRGLFGGCTARDLPDLTTSAPDVLGGTDHQATQENAPVGAFPATTGH